MLGDLTFEDKVKILIDRRLEDARRKIWEDVEQYAREHIDSKKWFEIKNTLLRYLDNKNRD